jgi:hypothetical protein
MEKIGIRFLRFTDKEAKVDMQYVIRAIENYIVAFEKELKGN